MAVAFIPHRGHSLQNRKGALQCAAPAVAKRQKPLYLSGEGQPARRSQGGRQLKDALIRLAARGFSQEE
jgi:hypothetical protein